MGTGRCQPTGAGSRRLACRASSSGRDTRWQRAPRHLPGGRFRPELDATLAKEARRLDLLVTRSSQLLFGGFTIVGVIIALTTSRDVGVAVGGASALYFGGRYS